MEKTVKKIESTKSKYILLFKVACYLINYLHRRRLDVTYHIEEHNDDEDDDGCVFVVILTNYVVDLSIYVDTM
jgi:hypothetical protein